MKARRAWLAVLTTASFARLAVAGAQTAYYDVESGLPRCVSSAADASDGVLLFWDESIHFSRPIYAVSLSDPRFGGLRANGGCSVWPSYLKAVKANDGWMVPRSALPSGARPPVLAGGRYSLPEAVRVRLRDAARGSNVFLQGVTGAQFLARRPLADFTREQNRRYTHAFGAGYSADIFKAWLEAQPRNAAFKVRILEAIQRSQNRRLAVSTATRLRGYTVLINQGFLQTPRKNRLAPFLRELSALGIAHRVVFNPVGTIEANTAAFASELEDELRWSRHGPSRGVIVVGASKGVPEMLGAIASLHARDPALVRGIAAVVSLAGLFEGSYLADWAQGFPQMIGVPLMLAGDLADAGLPTTLNSAVIDGLTTESVARVTAGFSQRLPDLPYFNFVGVLTGAGVQADLTSLTDGHGADDGFVEYPGTTMPRAWNLHSTDIIFDSGHAILDGFYAGRDLARQDKRHWVFDGIFQAIADEIGAR